MTPQRIQLRRTKGWRKPEGAIVVARPTMWGNPYTIEGAKENGYQGNDEQLRAMCVSMFRAWLDSPYEWVGGTHRRQRILDRMSNLRGHDLACWCPLDQPCHADVLLEMANQ